MGDVGQSRRKIVDAALACAREHGWDATSMQAVRRRAGVSNGSLFHHFPGREDLAAAVVGAALADHQTALLRELHASTSTRDGVTRVVARHLRWVDEHRDLARLLLSATPDVLRGALDDHTIADNRGFFREIAAWLHDHGWPGHPDLHLMVALWIGPAQEHSRLALADPLRSVAGTTNVLAEGAWRALQPLIPPKKEP